MIEMDINISDPNLSMSASTKEDLQQELDINIGHEADYDKLMNLPTLNGRVIKGNLMEEDITVPQWAKEPTKPNYSSDEVGAVGKDDAMPFSQIDALFNAVFPVI